MELDTLQTFDQSDKKTKRQKLKKTKTRSAEREFNIVMSGQFRNVFLHLQVKHIYELTPTQARELKKLVGEIDDNSEDYIVSAVHAQD